MPEMGWTIGLIGVAWLALLLAAPPLMNAAGEAH